MINTQTPHPADHSNILDEIGPAILHHVSNSDSEHAILKLPPFFGIDMSVSKHVAMLWISAAVVFSIFYLATKRYRKEEYLVPSGFVNALESMVEYIRNRVVIPAVGKKDANLWMPLILTLFFFILTANGLGLIPVFELIPGGGGSTATGNFNVTAGLATVTFFSIIVAGSVKHGFTGHWKNVAPAGFAWPVYIILIPVEIIAMLVKPFALTMRLAANMTGGHIAILSIMSFIFVMGHLFGPIAGIAVGTFVSVPLSAGIYALEIIIALIQAYVFALLSAIFIGMAIHVHH